MDEGTVIAVVPIVFVANTGDGGTCLVALVAFAELRGELVGGGAVIVVEEVGGMEDGEEEDSLFGREEEEDSLSGRDEDCCLRRRGSFDMPSKSESFRERKKGRKKEK